jgi:hypothetical protein
LIATWVLGVAPVRLDVLAKVSIIVVGVIIASIGEIQFSIIGFLCEFFPFEDYFKMIYC